MARAKRKPFKIVSAPQTAHLYPLLQKIAFSANLCLTTDRLSDIIEHVPAVRCRTNLSDHGPVAQLVERILGKDEVSSSNLDSSSKGKHLEVLGLRGVFLRFFRAGGLLHPTACGNRPK